MQGSPTGRLKFLSKILNKNHFHIKTDFGVVRVRKKTQERLK